ncbi:MAG: dihydroorotase [Gammaproteobacteria bacterium]|nr:dihydroorotase [Gammaproteobacteria bacterium]
MGLVIKGGRLIDPANQIDARHDLYIKDGFVVAIDIAPNGFKAGDNLDANGKIVCPGLIDLRARLREPGQEYKATIESETRAAASAGITTLSCPPDTNPVVDTPAMAQMIQQRAWQIGSSFVHPVGALTRGLEGKQLTDMAALEEAGCVGVSNALQPVDDTLVMRRALQYAATFGLTVHLHSRDHWLQGNGCAHEGEVSTRLGLPAIPEAAETVGVARDLALIEQTGAYAHFCQLSCGRSVDMVASAQTTGLSVTADVTAHHLHLTEHDIGFFNSQCHVLPPLRSQRDCDRLRQGLVDGTITAICSDHQPHELDAKLAPFSESEPGISGLETLLPLTLKLVDDGLLDMGTALKLLTSGPASILGIDAGQLGVGATADVCIFDPDMQWTLSEKDLQSRGHNTPFLGWPFRGRVTHTLIGGQVVF